jgi:hypothetical protein
MNRMDCAFAINNMWTGLIHEKSSEPDCGCGEDDDKDE